MQQRIQLINLLSYITLIIVNIAALQIPFFGKTPGDVSDLYFNLLTPANFAFKIWSVIYVLLGVFIIHQSRSLLQKNRSLPLEISKIGFLFFISCLLNIAWLMAWQSLHILWSFLVIFSLWIVLIMLYSRLAKFVEARWYYTLPFSIYLAWVCIAALANLNILFIDLGYDFFGLSEHLWTSLLIILGIFGTILVLYLNQDIWFTIVLIWAYFGIYIKNKELPNEESLVSSTALWAMIILLIAGSWVGWRKMNRAA